MEAAGPDRFRESERVPDPVDVGGDDKLGIGGEIVDGGEVKEVVDPAFQSLRILCR